MPLFFVVFLSIYFLDFLTKMVLRSHFPLGAESKILPVFSLTHVQNTGIAFGLFQDRNWFFVAVGAVLTGLIVFLAWKVMRTDKWGLLSLAMILGGAFGNLTDRILRGSVTDFLDFHWGVHHWPAFNVADSAVCIGAAILFIQNLKSRPTHASHPL